MKRFLLSFVILHSAFVLAAPAADIVALVIGNNAYTRVEDTLDTPINDATLMQRTLQSIPGGADVKILTDATKEQIEIALNALKVRAQGAKLALVFYSGHGTEDQPDGFAQAAIHLGEYRKMKPGPVEEYCFFDHPSGYRRIKAAMVWKAENLKDCNEPRH